VSPILNIAILPIGKKEINKAQKIIMCSLVHNFGSLDAIIAATASEFKNCDSEDELIVITSDKGLKACLDKCSLPYWDAFKIYGAEA
jgi:DNA integrity scanning protein DisA with diadenylate cyclase activity